jgi:hypothetical protein
VEIVLVKRLKSVEGKTYSDVKNSKKGKCSKKRFCQLEGIFLFS